MPTLKLNSATTNRRSVVMDDVNQVDRSESDTSSSNKIVFQHENGNINLDDLLSRNSVKDLTLESDEILVIGYTEGNNSLDEIAKTAKDKQAEHEDNANKPDLINVNNVIEHNDNLYVSVNDSTDQTSNKGASNQSSSLNDENQMGEKSLFEPNVNIDVDTSSPKSDDIRCLNINGGCSKQVENESWGVTDEEPIHMTLEDVQLSLYDWEFPVTESNDNQVPNKIHGFSKGKLAEDKIYQENEDLELRGDAHAVENSKIIESNALYHHRVPQRLYSHRQNSPTERSPNSRSLKHTLCHWLGLGKCTNAEVDGASSYNFSSGLPHPSSVKRSLEFSDDSREPSSSIVNRALPPLPSEKSDDELDNKSAPTLTNGEDETKSSNDLEALAASERIVPDFAVSICKVKDCGWYWGPISGEMAEKILSSEPDGSFVVRDSSDERYIFSLTFKLNGFVRHVRIEHDHGNFSFGSFTKFKSHTIVEFIENAVRHSRSGRYLFFLHRRPALGPMRVQLLYPVSRFKRVQSLQHMCRFVILKAVRRDLIAMLPLPLKLKNYLDTQQYYTEQMQDMQSPAAAVNFDQFGSLESIS